MAVRSTDAVLQGAFGRKLYVLLHFHASITFLSFPDRFRRSTTQRVVDFLLAVLVLKGPTKLQECVAV